MDPEIVLKRKKELLKDVSEWLKSHDDAFPKTYIIRDKKKLKRPEMKKEDLEEVKLARRWERHFKEEKELYENYKKMTIEEVPEEYRAIIAALNKEKNENKTKKSKKITKVLTLVEWIKLHDRKFPKIPKEKKEEQTPEQKEEEKMYRIYKAPYVKRIEEEYKDTPLEEIPEDYREYMQLARQRGIKTKFFEKMIEWLETHDGRPPRFSKRVDGRRLNRKEMSEDEVYEARLNSNWNLSKERKILESYIGVPLEKIPEEYRSYIEKMRSFGYGVKEDCYPEIIRWLENHGGMLPRTEIGSSKEKMTLEEIKYEEELRKKWNRSTEKRILDEYLGIEIEEVPEEYREKIIALREYGLGIEEKEIYDQLIEWLDSHNRNMPRADIRVNGKPLKRGELSKEEKKEVLLRYRWNVSELKGILDKYAEEPIEEVPEEFRGKIQSLRGYGLGLTKKKEFDTFNEMIEWLKNNNGKYPRTIVTNEHGERKKSEEFTAQESYEISLSHRWYRTKEREIFIQYETRPIEEVPDEFRERIAELRKYKKEQHKKHNSSIITWLETHDGRMPKAGIYRDGIRIKTEEMTPEEIAETREYRSWKKSKLKSVLNEYAGKPIEEVPEEYREEIEKLRGYGQLGRKKSEQIKTKMKLSVAKQVSENESVRNELEMVLLKDEETK